MFPTICFWYQNFSRTENNKMKCISFCTATRYLKKKEKEKKKRKKKGMIHQSVCRHFLTTDSSGCVVFFFFKHTLDYQPLQRWSGLALPDCMRGRLGFLPECRVTPCELISLQWPPQSDWHLSYLPAPLIRTVGEWRQPVSGYRGVFKKENTDPSRRR